MGYRPHMSSSDWKEVKAEKKIDSRSSFSDLYASKATKDTYLPYGINRESRDSEAHPNSTGVVFGLDSTGSMSHIYEMVAKRLGELVVTIFDREIVPGAHIMFAAIDDSFHCKTPLQVTQFEVDRLIADQLLDLHFTGHGGGNDFESYQLLWYFCSRHTLLDCYEKRGKKGFLLTVGDDGYPDRLTKNEIKEVFGDDVQGDILTTDLLAEINKKYDVYHVCLEQGGSYRRRDMDSWTELLGSHAISLSDYNKLPELIISLLQVHYGKDINEVVKDWDGTTGLIVKEALKNMMVKKTDETGLVEFD